MEQSYEDKPERYNGWNPEHRLPEERQPDTQTRHGTIKKTKRQDIIAYPAAFRFCCVYFVLLLF